jgi:hypothetical protein
MDNQFSSIKLYHTIFPAITFYKLFDMAGRIDRLIHGTFTRMLNMVSSKGFKGWATIHKTGPGEAESDEMLFVYSMLSPLLGLLFPFMDELREAKFVDSLPAKERQKLMAYYEDCLKRHLYATGQDKILLEKVALIAGRLRSVFELFPDMRIIHLLRHPYQSVPSLMNMFNVPLSCLAPQVKQNPQAIREVADMIFQYYQHLLDLKRHLPETQLIEVRYLTRKALLSVYTKNSAL